MLICISALTLTATLILGADSLDVIVDTREVYIFDSADSELRTVDTRPHFIWADSSGITVDTRNHEIEVEQPIGSLLTNGSAITDFGILGTNEFKVRSYLVRNLKNYSQVGLTIQKSGLHTADFIVGALNPSTLNPGASGTFSVTFAPNGTGLRSAQIQITGTSFSGSAFNISLTGRAYSATADSDGDGMNDLAENHLNSLQFDWQINQTSMVEDYFANANRNNLFTESQIREMNIDRPLLKRSLNGEFTLTLGLEKSEDLLHFEDFPMTAPQAVINGAGKLEFRFFSSDDAAFFRLGTD